MPPPNEIYAQLQGSKIFSALDMRSGYFHIELSEEAKPKTAFVPGGPMDLNTNLIDVHLDYLKHQLISRG